MRKREKLTPEERFSLALELVKRERSFEEICLHYQVSHTTAYKIRNAFLDGGRRALAGARARLDAEGGDAPRAAHDGASALSVDESTPADDARALPDRNGGEVETGLAAGEPMANAEAMLDDDGGNDFTRR